MTRAFLVATTLLAACGGAPTDCPGFAPTVTLVSGVSCVDVEHDWNAARLALLGMGLSDARLARDWHLTYVPHAWPDPAGMVAGQTQPATHTVVISADSRCVLTHEMFHMYEWDVLHVANPTHAGWRERGWFDAVEAVCRPKLP